MLGLLLATVTAPLYLSFPMKVWLPPSGCMFIGVLIAYIIAYSSVPTEANGLRVENQIRAKGTMTKNEAKAKAELAHDIAEAISKRLMAQKVLGFSPNEIKQIICGRLEEYADQLRAELAKVKAELKSVPLQPGIKHSDCIHSSYWITNYGNCMVCEREKVERELAELKDRIACINGQRNVMANNVAGFAHNDEQMVKRFWDADKAIGELCVEFDPAKALLFDQLLTELATVKADHAALLAVAKAAKFLIELPVSGDWRVRIHRETLVNNVLSALPKGLL